MKTHAILALAASTLLVTNLRSPAHELSETERARVASEATAFLSTYREVLEGDDPEAIHGLFVDDERFAWFSDGEQAYSSAEDVIEGLASMQGMTFSTETSSVEVMPLTPDLAHARTAFQTKILQGEVVVYEFSGVITWLLEEVADGEWRVLTGHTSTPKPR